MAIFPLYARVGCPRRVGGTFSGGLCSARLASVRPTAQRRWGADGLPEQSNSKSEFSAQLHRPVQKIFSRAEPSWQRKQYLSGRRLVAEILTSSWPQGIRTLESTTHPVRRFAYFGLTDLPVDPLGTGLCLDRCSEKYHTKMVVIGVNHVFTQRRFLM